jgi:hypothetical protein
MGAFFTNLQVRKASAQATCAALEKMDLGRAYVSPDGNGWVTVYCEATDEQDIGTMGNLASGLSKTLKTEVLGFLVHDSDIAMYWLYRNGELIDEFNSAPNYFEQKEFSGDGPQGGNADVLLPLCVTGTTRAQLEALLHPSDGFPLMVEEIVADLSKLLGIDDTRSNLGFTYFEQEGEGILPDIAEFQPVGKGTERKEAKPKAKPGAFAQPMRTIPDMYPIAVTMLTQVWNREYEQQLETMSKMSGRDASSMISKLRDGFDRSARDFLKQSKLPNLPTIDELKAARDQGPDALAELIAKRTPGQLAEIGIGVANAGVESFLAALLKHGLEPNAPNTQGYTTLKAAERHGLNSSIYRLAKAAAERNKE